jgi:hypothetical protein
MFNANTIHKAAVLNAIAYFAATASSRSKHVLQARSLLASVLFNPINLPPSQFTKADIARTFQVDKKLVIRARRICLTTPNLLMLSKPKVESEFPDISLNVLSDTLVLTGPVFCCPGSAGKTGLFKKVARACLSDNQLLDTT